MNNHYLKKVIRPFQSSFTELENKIADYLIQTTRNLATCTLDDLANEIGVSNSSLYKFVRKIGYNGYQDFRVSIATNQNTSTNPYANFFPNFQTIEKEDSPHIIAQKVLNANLYSLSNSLEYLDEEKLTHILESISHSKAFHFFGVGGSSITAYDSYHTFLRSKYWCNYISDTHLQLSVAHKYTKDDCIFLFSHSGLSSEILHVAKAIRETPAKIIVLTGNAASPLCKYADEVILVVTEEAIFRTEAMMSRISYITIMDILYVNLMYLDYDNNYQSLKQLRKTLSSRKILQTPKD
ncbi:MurR/RpiR family transcriptional regulator [Atopobacter sp. AH10]|uniref:MurR/RpiR family transcriptional regulator n=1 Tax=Atopobacter sp. AH10 TaxID=2315861 RepID=UPI000EF208AD|nr:MurR/RpiR family transcriptional regulator [Atopobacter sp. AH10]RLK63483.1 MurR/RpiR family transcriptional regulator [Atopobacter sp. AH10]